MKQAHAEVLKTVIVLAPQDITATATNTNWMDVDQCVGQVEFEILFGALTATDSSTSEMAVTVLASTSADTDAGTAIAFSYQLSEALGTDTMGAVTAATSSGITINSSTDDNKVLVIYVEPAVLKAVGEDYRWACVNIDGTTNVTAALVAGMAHYTPRYAQASQPSST